MTDAAGNWPLSGTKVLELGHIVAGPSAGLILADLGADVMKIEQPDVGDAARNMPNYGSTFYFLNRNKRSLALDLKSSEAKAIFEKLVSHAKRVHSGCRDSSRGHLAGEPQCFPEAQKCI